jgi:hypothetical protein
MKKFILFVMRCIPAALMAQNGVTVSNLAVSGGTVTFDVSWKNTGMQPVWSDTVWVWVDYNKNGVMERLPLSAGATLTATSPGGKVVEALGNDQGVWVVGNARTNSSFSATVKLLTTITNIGGACVYGSNYPPVGKYTSTTNIAFTGTPQYTIVLKKEANSTTETHTEDSPFTVPAGFMVQSFIDKTGAPGMLVPATYTLSGSNGCVGTGVTLTLSGSQLGWRYQLYSGATAVGSVVNGTGNALAFPDAPTAGGYSYTVWTVDNSAIVAQRAMQVSNVHAITVQALPAAATITASAATVCQKSTITLSVPSASNTTYTWTASAGTSSSNSYTFNTATTGAKTATVQLTVLAVGVTFQSAVSAEKTSTVQALPAAATITASAATVCQNTALVFTVPVATNTTYTWAASAGTSSSNSHTFNTAVAGAKTATVQLTVLAGGVTCQSAVSAMKTSTVQALPAAATITASAATVCQNGTLRFTVPSVANTTYTWTASAGTSSSNSYTFNTSAAGAKTATVQLTVLAGGVTCQSAVSGVKTSTVQALPAAATITASAATVCQNGTLRFTVPSAANTTYTWTASAGTPSSNSYTFNTSTTGAKTATVQLTVLAGDVTCQSAVSGVKTSTVQALPATPTITASAATVCQNTALVFTVPVATNTTYTWAASAGTPSSNSYTFNTATAGAKTATVQLTVLAGGMTCQSAEAALTAMVSQPGTNDQPADPTCLCAPGLSNCSGTCRTACTPQYSAGCVAGETRVSANSESDCQSKCLAAAAGYPYYDYAYIREGHCRCTRCY